MPLTVDIVAAIAALAIVSPQNGETVSVDAPEKPVQRPVRLAWSGGGDGVTILAVKPEGGERELFSITNATEAYITNLELGRRYAWGVVPEEGGSSAAASFTAEGEPPRLLRVEGLGNIRDLGGWTGLGGRRVKQGMVFRSAGLRASSVRKGGSTFAPIFQPGVTNVTDAALEYMRGEFGIKTEIDLRPRDETVFMASSLLGPDVAFVKIPFPSGADIDDIVRGREPFIKIFRRFLDEKNYPVIFHCADGIDRTGTLAFILNGLLGVSEADLRRDWEASGRAVGNTSAIVNKLESLVGYLRSSGGRDMAECCEDFAKGCGVSDDEIAAFRAIMLEGGAG